MKIIHILEKKKLPEINATHLYVGTVFSGRLETYYAPSVYLRILDGIVDLQNSRNVFYCNHTDNLLILDFQELDAELLIK